MKSYFEAKRNCSDVFEINLTATTHQNYYATDSDKES